MSRRKAPKVTLAGPREQAVAAERVISRFRGYGDRASEAPTPERLVRARGGARVEAFSEIGPVAEGDRFVDKEIDLVRVRIEDDPLSRLAAAGRLAPKDPELNALLARAGLEYRSAWSRSGLNQIKAADPEKPVVSGSSPGMFASEAQANAFGVYCEASKSMHPGFRPVVDAVVLHEWSTVDAGRRYTAHRQAKTAAGSALVLLRLGLTDLARFFHLLPPEIDLSSPDAGSET